jgi:hypothetical protein
VLAIIGSAKEPPERERDAKRKEKEPQPVGFGSCETALQ